PGLADGMRRVFRIPVPLLAGKIALAKGDQRAGIERLREAVAIEDTIPYNEPPVWRYPMREALGGALLRDGQAAEAEKVFRQELVRSRRSGRALFGLTE